MSSFTIDAICAWAAELSSCGEDDVEGWAAAARARRAVKIIAQQVVLGCGGEGAAGPSRASEASDIFAESRRLCLSITENWQVMLMPSDALPTPAETIAHSNSSSVPKRMQLSFPDESNNFMFDQIYRKQY